MIAALLALALAAAPFAPGELDALRYEYLAPAGSQPLRAGRLAVVEDALEFRAEGTEPLRLTLDASLRVQVQREGVSAPGPLLLVEGVDPGSDSFPEVHLFHVKRDSLVDFERALEAAGARISALDTRAAGLRSFKPNAGWRERWRYEERPTAEGREGFLWSRSLSPEPGEAWPLREKWTFGLPARDTK